MTRSGRPHVGIRGALAIVGGGCLIGAVVGFGQGGWGRSADAVPIVPVSASQTAAVRAPGTTPTPPAAVFSAPPASSGAPPVELRIAGRPPVPLDPVGSSADGNVDIPADPARAGWWAAGAAPADPAGTTVLVGHLDSATGGLGAFAALLHVSAGQRLEVVDSAGVTREFRVSARDQRPKASLPSGLFTTTGPRRLVLVTCGGAFDAVHQRYADNVIVTAVPDD